MKSYFYIIINLQASALLFNLPCCIFIVESHFKDNPALSMLNDSDDDVVYG